MSPLIRLLTFPSDARELASRNSHGVPYEVLKKKVNAFEIVPPLYYAWFLSLNDSVWLLNKSKDLLSECIQNCEEFSKDFQKFSSMINLPSMMSHYSRQMCMASNKIIMHCTAKFCGKNGGRDFAQRKVVEDNMGRVQRLKVIGLVFSKDTFGARIEIEGEQLELYEQDDDENTSFRQYSGKKKSGRNYGSAASNSSSSPELDIVPDDSQSSVTYEPMDENTNRFYPIPGKGRRAHITLGTAEGVRPVNTGFDLLDLVKLERDAQEQNLDVPTFALGSGVLRQYKSALWAFYLEQTMVLDAIFTGHY